MQLLEPQASKTSLANDVVFKTRVIRYVRACSFKPPCDVVPVCASPNNTCACYIVDTLGNQSEGRATISGFFPRSLALLPDAYLRASGSHPKSEVLKVGVPSEVREMQIDLWHQYADNLFDNEALMERYTNRPAGESPAELKLLP